MWIFHLFILILMHMQISAISTSSSKVPSLSSSSTTATTTPSSTTTSTASTGSSATKTTTPIHDIDECGIPDICHEHGYCINFMEGYSCTCNQGYTGNNCEHDVDECMSNPCINGTCIDGKGKYSCNCVDGFIGTNCDKEFDNCLYEAQPCHYGYCINGLNTYHCICDPGHTGYNCEQDIDYCAVHPCVNGTCFNDMEQYFCDCDPGYTGTKCDKEIDECASNPCHNGTCIDGINMYSCTCNPGYTGQHCDQDVDECMSNPCQNGTCINDENMYNCICTQGYTGQNCDQDIDECASNPCHNSTCIDDINMYSCTCNPGYTGQNCDQDVDECASNPCQNGICINGRNIYNCNCTQGYAGQECDQEVTKVMTTEMITTTNAVTTEITKTITTNYITITDQHTTTIASLPAFYLLILKQGVIETTTILDIHISAMEQFPKNTNFVFYVNGNYTNNVKHKENMFTISGLQPGKCYQVQVVASADNMQTSKSKVVTGCTNPTSPTITTSVIQSQTGNAVGINITQTAGSVEYFEIYVNSKMYGTVMASAKNNITQFVMYKLKPGTMYTISANAVSNNFRSSSSPVLRIQTCPSPPVMIQCTDQSQTSVSINITKGWGNVDLFNVFLNDKRIEQVKPSTDVVTSYNINGLNAGTFYTIYATAVSLTLTSSKSPQLVVQTDKASPTSVRYTAATMAGACIGSATLTTILLVALLFVIRRSLICGKDNGEMGDTIALKQDFK